MKLEELSVFHNAMNHDGAPRAKESSAQSACAICHTGQSMGLEITDEAALTAWLTDDLAPLCVALDNP